MTDADIVGSIKITKVAEHNQLINKFTIVGAYKVDDEFVVMLRGSNIVALRTNTQLLRKVEDEFLSKVWFIEADAGDRRFIENLFFPSEVLMVNLIWLPDGSKLTRVIISAGDIPEMQHTIEKIKRIAKQIRNIELVVEFDQHKMKLPSS